jgi:hypothetical protein
MGGGCAEWAAIADWTPVPDVTDPTSCQSSGLILGPFHGSWSMSEQTAHFSSFSRKKNDIGMLILCKKIFFTPQCITYVQISLLRF